MDLRQHLEESQALFGQGFPEVHIWLDEFAGKPGYGMRHRCVRHHEAGVTEVERLFGPLASKAARQHIISDLSQEGWTPRHPFPKDETDYKCMGLF